MKYFIGKVRNRDSSGLLGKSRYIGVRGCDLKDATDVVDLYANSIGISNMVLELTEINRDDIKSGPIESKITYTANDDLECVLSRTVSAVDTITGMKALLRAELTRFSFILIHSASEENKMKYTYYHGTYILEGESATREFVVLGYNLEDASIRARSFISPSRIVRMSTKDFDLDSESLNLPWLIKYSYFVGMVKHEHSVTHISKNRTYAILKLMDDHLKKYCFISLDSVSLNESNLKKYRVKSSFNGPIGGEIEVRDILAYNSDHATLLTKNYYGTRLKGILSVNEVFVSFYHISVRTILDGIAQVDGSIYSTDGGLSDLIIKLEGMPNFDSIVSVKRIVDV